jgi:hypothetical protein
MIAVEDFVSIGITARVSSRGTAGTRHRSDVKASRIGASLFLRSPTTPGVAFRRLHFRDWHGLHPDVTLRIEKERRCRTEGIHVAELPPVVRDFEFDARAGTMNFGMGFARVDLPPNYTLPISWRRRSILSMAKSRHPLSYTSERSDHRSRWRFSTLRPAVKEERNMGTRKVPLTGGGAQRGIHSGG